MNWLLLGYGDLAEKRVAEALRFAHDSHLSGVWGRDANKAHAFSRRHEIPAWFAGEEGLKKALDENAIDAVYICTPVCSHYSYAKLALESGKHVLCEKPMALSVGECDDMIALASHKKLMLGVAYYRRCFPKMIRIKELLESGEPGQILRVSMNYQGWFKPELNDTKYWRVIPEQSGAG